ncbi:MAG: hypothetical protein RDU14_15845 [Melioribacteraceae bacterium]|nr:hypothetical protein [Melioribacteraceae bacterium]
MNIFLIVISLMFYVSVNYAQFEVEFNETKGALTKNDKYKAEFGRYDGYQIPLYAGEAVNFVVYSEKFNPRIVFVSPKGNVFKQGVGTDNMASIITTVPEEGEWVLYVVGDAEALGEYTFQYAFAAANSLQLLRESDFCTTLNFLLAHSKAYFLLLENPADSQQSYIKLNDSKDAFVDDSDGSYTAVFLETDNLKEAERIHKKLAEDIAKCLDKNWNTKSDNWQNFDDYKVKSVSYTEKVKEKERFIKVLLLDLKGSKQKFLNDYVVQIVINRNQ